MLMHLSASSPWCRCHSCIVLSATALQDTVVKDPFYEHMGLHFGMTFKELLAAKHPDTWILFEKGDIGEAEAMQNFFKDGREVDTDALKAMMVCTSAKVAACLPSCVWTDGSSMHCCGLLSLKLPASALMLRCTAPGGLRWMRDADAAALVSAPMPPLACCTWQAPACRRSVSQRVPMSSSCACREKSFITYQACKTCCSSSRIMACPCTQSQTTLCGTT